MPAEPFKFDGVLDDWKKNQIMRFCQETVLDIGCNTGELVGYLNSIGRKAEGIDNEHRHLVAARQKFPNAIFHEGTDLSQFTDNQFKTVVAWNVLEHISNDHEALRQFIRIAGSNVILSVPKEDEISLPYSRVTYRPYVDPTHYHYYTRNGLRDMISRIGRFDVYIEGTTPVRPMMVYNKIGIPRKICSMLDSFFKAVGTNKEILLANFIVVITK